MDIDRPDLVINRRRRRRYLTAAALSVMTIVVTILWKLSPGLPQVERSGLLIDTVRRGSLIREVRGLGTVATDRIRWIATSHLGRVERIMLRPGAEVAERSVIMVLRNPDIEQAAVDADSQLKSAEAEYLNLKAQVDRDILQAEADAASANDEYSQLRLKAEVNRQLYADGLVAPLEYQLAQAAAEQAKKRDEIQQKRLGLAKAAVAPQLAVKAAEVDRLRDQVKLRHEDADALTIRAGMSGVLQLLPVDTEGALVQPGANVAQVADPKELKAQVFIPENLAKDIRIGQVSRVDTHDGVVAAKVSRIDPSVQNGTVTVDLAFIGKVPEGVRPDLSVEATIQLEELRDVLYVGRPSVAEPGTRVALFKIQKDSATADRVEVELGKASSTEMEVRNGLAIGDQVILSDLSQFLRYQKIRLD